MTDKIALTCSILFGEFSDKRWRIWLGFMAEKDDESLFDYYDELPEEYRDDDPGVDPEMAHYLMQVWLADIEGREIDGEVDWWYLTMGEKIEYPEEKMSQESYFDGGLLQLIAVKLLGWIITLLTLGICAPFAIVLVNRWECKHTVIDGHRLKFVGTGIGLFGQWIKMILLCVITLGIYSFWLGIALKKWVVKNTVFE